MFSWSTKQLSKVCFANELSSPPVYHLMSFSPFSWWCNGYQHFSKLLQVSLFILFKYFLSILFGSLCKFFLSFNLSFKSNFDSNLIWFCLKIFAFLFSSFNFLSRYLSFDSN
jgi:hypothetical protein